MHRVIFNTHQPYGIRAAELMQENDGWKPVYWMCKPAQMHYLKRRFGPDLILHDYLDAVHGRFPSDISKSSHHLFDPDKLTAIEEATALNMLTRNDSYSQNMGYAERFEFLAHTIGYWMEIIHLTKATCVVFEEVPHQAIDYALFLSAKICDILTIIPMRGLPDTGFFAASQIGETPAALSPDNESHALGARAGTGAKRFIDSMQGSYDDHINMILWNQTASVRKMLRNEPSVAQFFSFINSLSPSHSIKEYWHNLFNFRNDQKVSNATLQASDMNYITFLYYKWKNIAQKNLIRKLYQRISSPCPDLNQPFIYCCLQYQPEASTSPMAGRYVNQWLMVDHLAAALPEGWHIYVKEHPSQFATEFARYGEAYRSHAFYERLVSNDKVSLVPLDVDSFTLIDASRAVASPGGTVCFEAVARGKMAINFAGGFFVGCPGIVQVKTAEQVSTAVAIITSGVTPSREDVVNHAIMLDQNIYPGGLGPPRILDHLGVSAEENAKLHQLCWRDVASWKRETV